MAKRARQEVSSTSRGFEDLDLTDEDYAAFDMEADQAGLSGGGRGSKEGYGKNITPMTTWNIYQLPQRIPFTVKRQEYLSFDFTTNTQPIALAYQVLDWWFPSALSRNRLNYDALAGMALGQIWKGGTITLEVYAVTRQRLLQGGQTNYLTYDFETSQNLFLTKFDRLGSEYVYPQVGAEGYVTFDAVRANNDAFSPRIDGATREEIPQRERKQIHIKFQHPHHNYLWKPVLSQNLATRTPGPRMTVVMAPGPPGCWSSPLEGQQYGLKQSEFIDDSQELGPKQQTVWNRSTYPMYCVHPPQVEDETGQMKWRYQMRVTTELHTEFFLRPDYDQGLTNDVYNRQLLEQPSLTQEDSAGNATAIRILCPCYEIKV